MITVRTVVNGSIDDVWEHFTNPDHIVHWYFASEDWHSPWAKNNLCLGGEFTIRMAAKDGSFGFDFQGVYTALTPKKTYTYQLEDGRDIKVTFEEKNGTVTVQEAFEPETENDFDQQRDGWQSILNQFKKYHDGLTAGK